MAVPTGAERSKLGIPAPEWEEFYSKNADIVPTLQGPAAHQRAVMSSLKDRAMSIVPPITEGVTAQNHSVKMSDGASIQVRVYTPTAEGSAWPAVYYIHGGGWTLGDLEGEDIVCRALCVYARVVAVSVDYRLAPEHPYPTGLNDSWAALQWTISNASQLKIDPNQIIIGGSSSGANFSASLAHRARDSGVKLKGQALRIPAVCHMDAYPPELEINSLEECKDAPILAKISMRTFYDYYAAPPTDPAVSPLLSSNFKGLAPAYVQIAGMDPLRDEGLAYVTKLQEAGVPVKLDLYPGLPHGFGFFPELPQSGKNGADLIGGVMWLLST